MPKEIDAKPGDEIIVRVKKRGGPNKRVQEDARARDVRKVVLPVDDETTRYIRRVRGGIEFYDLGTRKQGDGTYRHMQLETITTRNAQAARAFLRDQFMAKILEPEAASALALPHESAYLYTDIVFKNEEGEEVRELLAPANIRPFVADYPNYDGASWPAVPPPVEVSNWKDGSLKFKHPGSWSVRIEGAYIYNTFDTDHYTFKVTETFDPTAPGIPFRITSKDKVKIYLTPRLYEMADVIDDNPANGPSALLRWSLARTAPVVPNFELFAGPILDGQVISLTSDAYFNNTRALPHYWSAINDWLISAGGPSIQYDLSWQNDTWSPEVTLSLTPVYTFAAFVGMIQRNKEKFYVWRTDVSLSGGSGFGHFYPLSAATRLYNPTY